MLQRITLPMLLPVGCIPGRHVPDEMQIKTGSYFSPSFHLFLKFEAYFGPTLVRSGKWFIFMALLIDHLLLRSL